MKRLFGIIKLRQIHAKNQEKISKHGLKHHHAIPPVKIDAYKKKIHDFGMI